MSTRIYFFYSEFKLDYNLTEFDLSFENETSIQSQHLLTQTSLKSFRLFYGIKVKSISSNQISL